MKCDKPWHPDYANDRLKGKRKRLQDFHQFFGTGLYENIEDNHIAVQERAMSKKATESSMSRNAKKRKDSVAADQLKSTPPPAEPPQSVKKPKTTAVSDVVTADPPLL